MRISYTVLESKRDIVNQLSLVFTQECVFPFFPRKNETKPVKNCRSMFTTELKDSEERSYLTRDVVQLSHKKEL